MWVGFKPHDMKYSGLSLHHNGPFVFSAPRKRLFKIKNGHCLRWREVTEPRISVSLDLKNKCQLMNNSQELFLEYMHVSKIKYIVWLVEVLYTSPHPVIQSHPFPNPIPLLAPRHYFHLRFFKIMTDWDRFEHLYMSYELKHYQNPGPPHLVATKVLRGDNSSRAAIKQ